MYLYLQVTENAAASNSSNNKVAHKNKLPSDVKKYGNKTSNQKSKLLSIQN